MALHDKLTIAWHISTTSPGGSSPTVPMHYFGACLETTDSEPLGDA
jgi:hypothetical protein